MPEYLVERNTIRKTVSFHEDHPVIEGKIVVLAILEPRSGRSRRNRHEGRDGFVGRCEYGWDDRRSGQRTARGGTFRKRRVAERHFDFVEGHAGPVRRKLREVRVRAGADVLRSAGDPDSTVSAQFHSGCGREPCGDPRATGHSPAQRHTVALHRANDRIALGPAELLYAECKTFKQMARREWKSQSLIDLRLIDDPKFHWIDLELMRHFIHRGFSRVQAGHCARAAHIGAAADVSLRAAERNAQVRYAVMKRSRLAAIFMVRVEHRPLIDVIVLQRDQFALWRCADTDALLGARPMTDGVEHHLAGEYQSHRPAELPRCSGGERTQRPWPQFAAET